MKGVLLLGVVGAAIYTALVVSHDLLQSDRADHRLSSQGLTRPTTRQLRSWGTDLPALASSQESSPRLRKPAVMPGSSASNPTQHLDGLARAEENQLPYNPTPPHTSPLNGSESHLPRGFIVKPLSHCRQCGSISLVRHCRS
jgi:hypothetical protein